MRPNLNTVKQLIPPLSPHFHKGQHGRLGVVGGSEDYTGAPYFSSTATFRTGADMCHILCEPSAAVALKSYSPDLIVVPCLQTSTTTPEKSLDKILDQAGNILQRLHAVIVGPGLSRDAKMLQCAKGIVQRARELKLPIVMDADGLYLVQQDPEVIKGYPHSILTPNVNEFRRLCEAMNINTEGGPEGEAAQKLSKALGGPTIVQKGQRDIIANAKHLFVCSEEGGLKRCGGQGDILSGILGTWMAWGALYCKDVWSHDRSISPDDIPALAAY
ncbi:hypothetical protein H4R34_005369, partial [Dimargaris verticillata]